jgi:hypothetical protein
MASQILSGSLMPLPAPTAKRTRMHVRGFQLDGYKRKDDCWDIKARRVGAKGPDYPLSPGLRKRGEAMPSSGYFDQIAAEGSQLIGLNLFHGFRMAVKNLFRSARGCSHVSELASFLPAAALQTVASSVRDNDDSGHKPYQLDRCLTLESNSDAVQRHYPRCYRGQKPG